MAASPKKTSLSARTRGARVSGYWELPPDLAARFSYVGRVQPTDTWMGGGREWVSQGSIAYEQLGTFTRVPWSAYGN